MTSSAAKLIFHGLSAIALLWALYLHWRVRSIAKWPKVAGVIRLSGVRSDVDNNDEPQISYTYDREGRNYASSQILPVGSWATSGRYAADFAAKYPVGSSVTVYVNPHEPKDSVLERSMPPLVFVLLYGAVLLFAIVPVSF